MQIDSVLLPVPQEELAGAEISAAFAAAKTATQAAAVARKDKQAEAAGGGAGAGTVDAASATVGPVVAGGTVDAMAMEGPAPSEGPAMLDQAAPGAVAAAIAGALGSAIEAATLEDALIEANLTALLEDVEVRGVERACRKEW